MVGRGRNLCLSFTLPTKPRLEEQEELGLPLLLEEVCGERKGGNFLERQGMEGKEKRGRPGGKEGEKMQSTASEIDQRRNELLLSPTTQCNCMQAFAPLSPFLNSQ